MDNNNKVEMDMNNMEDVFDAMLNAQCDQLKKEQDAGANEEEKLGAIGVLNKFKNYIQSRRFDESCKAKAKEIGVKDYKIIKNAYVANFLGKIADVLNLTIRITADVIMYAVEFICRLANVLVGFTTTVCSKIINLFTLNCATV